MCVFMLRPINYLIPSSVVNLLDPCNLFSMSRGMLLIHLEIKSIMLASLMIIANLLEFTSFIVNLKYSNSLKNSNALLSVCLTRKLLQCRLIVVPSMSALILFSYYWHHPPCVLPPCPPTKWCGRAQT
jgi:hypothetical protein